MRRTHGDRIGFNCFKKTKTRIWEEVLKTWENRQSFDQSKLWFGLIDFLISSSHTSTCVSCDDWWVTLLEVKKAAEDYLYLKRKLAFSTHRSQWMFFFDFANESEPFICPGLGSDDKSLCLHQSERIESECECGANRNSDSARGVPAVKSEI